jgi:hypothetical protein
MKILIRNPAPDDPADQPFWGDFHFGNALSDSLRLLGCEVKVQYWPNWSASEAADALIVLRGLRASEAIEGEFGQKLIWLISHPEDVGDEELRRFDTVLCGSEKHTDELQKRGHDAHVFLQCTDDRIFFPAIREKSRLENGFVFVGNWRGGNRSLVGRAMSAQLPLKIWGRVWTRPAHQPYIVDDYLSNAQLGELYRASYCTLNDHWPDMSGYHYVNNRVFDALACALPVLSDPNPGIEKLNLGGIMTFDPEDSFDDFIDQFIVNYEAHQEAAYNDSFVILDQHTFTARARALVDLLSG